jgi:digeranylgeranylglycerophospholipid reductase
MGLGLKLKSAIKSFGYWGTILNFYRTKQLADELLERYEAYPSHPDDLSSWQADRDDLMDRVYETTGAEPKY